MQRIILFFFVLLFLVTKMSVPQSSGIDSPSGVQVAFPFFDNVEDTTVSSSYWQRDPALWKMQIANAHSGSIVWAMPPTTGNYNYLTLASNIDLSSTPNPYLSFWVRKSEAGNGALSVEASNDGGTSWTVISQPSFNGTLYVRFQFPLTNFRQVNSRIRIGCYAPYGSTYYVDDILIDNAPVPQPIVLSLPQDNGMKIHWNQSTATDFYSYRIILSTDAANVNNYFVAPGVSNRGETVVFDVFNKTTLDSIFTDLTFTNTLYYAKVYEQDSQDLINQGSDRADLSTTFNVTQQTTPFVQDFEGTFNWAADLPWAVSTNDAGDPGHSPTHAYEDSPDGNYPSNADRRLVMQVNLAGVQRPLLKFNHKFSFEQSADFGYLEISGDNTTWTALAGFTGNNSGEWQSREFDIGVLKNQATGYVRFRTVSNGSTQQDGWHLDDVQVSTNNKTTAFPFFDNADTNAVSENNWVAGSYNIKIANDHTGGGQVWAIGPSGGNYNYLTLAGRMNLSSAPNPYISFWIKKADGTNGAFSIEASGDAGLTWSILPQGQQSFSGSQYVWFECPLSTFRQANVLVRIGCYAPYAGSYYVDDILIDNAPTPRALTLLTPTNNGMKVRWGISTAPDFGSYRVVLSNDQSQVNSYFTTASLNNRTETRVFDIFTQATIETTLTDLTFMNTIYYAKIYERDTQELINQGSDRADLATTFNTTAEVAPFAQTFEGTYSWAADLPWMVTNFDALDPGHSPINAFEDSPDGNYPVNADRRLIARINMTGVLRPVLQFNQKYTFEQNADYGYLDYSLDNATWTTITGFTGNTGGLWEKREFDAGFLKNATTAYVRFRTVSNSGTQLDGWHLDDVEIYNNTKTQPVPIIDSVEIDLESQNYWIPGEWDIKIQNAHSGNQVWAISPAGPPYVYLTLDGILNLSSAPNPYLDFWIKKANGGNGAISVEISNNAGLSYAILPQGQQSFSGVNYVNYNFSLQNYRQNNVVLRIGVYSPYGDTYLLDDITIADSTGFTGVEDFAGITPTDFELSQNYPNPFNPSTTIRYALPTESKVAITIFNLLGEEIATLVNDVQSSGYHEVVFNAATLSSGVYLYRINAVSSTGSKDFNSTKKLILLK